MARKPEIQYIGQFYIHGSEARVLAPEEKKKSRLRLPQIRQRKVENIYIDPFAITGMVTAVVLAVVMIFGAVQIGNAWDQYEMWSDRVDDLQRTNAALELEYRNGYDLEEIRATALGMGMVPVEELPVVNIQVTVPVPEPEITWWEDMVWLMEGLFA